MCLEACLETCLETCLECIYRLFIAHLEDDVHYRLLIGCLKVIIVFIRGVNRLFSIP